MGASQFPLTGAGAAFESGLEGAAAGAVFEFARLFPK